MAGVLFRFFCLKIAYHLVDGSPCFNGIGWCLSFYLHIELADVGDAEAAVVAEANKEMAVFLTFVFYLLNYANPSCHGSAEDADVIVYLDKVAVSFVDNAKSFDAFCHGIVEIDEAFHIFIGDTGVAHDIFYIGGLAVGTEDMGFGKEGALYPLGASWLVVDSLVHEVAVLGEDAQEAFLAYYADEEDSL